LDSNNVICIHDGQTKDKNSAAGKIGIAVTGNPKIVQINPPTCP